MVTLFAAMASLALMAFGTGLIVVTLRGSGGTIIDALCGESRVAPRPAAPVVRRAVRFRASQVPAMEPQWRAAA